MIERKCLNKKISLIHGLPPSKIVEVFAEKSYNFTDSPPQWIVEHDPELVTQYYEFNSSIPPFDDIRVRQAFNYAIDKEKILLNTLKNQGAIGSKGITPNVQLFNKYDFSEIKGYDYNPELAKNYLLKLDILTGKGSQMFGRIKPRWKHIYWLRKKFNIS